MTAGERLYGKMDTLVAFEIMISVEALRALIALERSIIVRLGLRGMRAAVHVLEVGCMTTVEAAGHHGVW